MLPGYAKGHRYCHGCPEFEACPKYAEFAEMNLGLGMDVRRNLQMIREGRTPEWLAEQDRTWRCPDCGRPIIVSSEFPNCHWCGHALREPAHRAD